MGEKKKIKNRRNGYTSKAKKVKNRYRRNNNMSPRDREGENLNPNSKKELKEY